LPKAFRDLHNSKHNSKKRPKKGPKALARLEVHGQAMDWSLNLQMTVKGSNDPRLRLELPQTFSIDAVLEPELRMLVWTLRPSVYYLLVQKENFHYVQEIVSEYAMSDSADKMTRSI
jgi:hypothetical protein